jgi:hypothetical protein
MPSPNLGNPAGWPEWSTGFDEDADGDEREVEAIVQKKCLGTCLRDCLRCCC